MDVSVEVALLVSDDDREDDAVVVCDVDCELVRVALAVEDTLDDLDDVALEVGVEVTLDVTVEVIDADRVDVTVELCVATQRPHILGQ